MATAVVAAFALRARRAHLVLAAVALALAAAAHAVLSGAVGGAACLAALMAGVGGAASGLAALGRAVGADEVAAGVVGAVLLCIVMTGTFWADPVADTLPRAVRYPFRQAVLDADALLAAAYGAADHDRLHDGEVYGSVRLAASTFRPPAGLPTAGLWCAVALAGWGLALLLRVDREDEGSPA